METEYLTVNEVAAALRCHPHTIYARLEDGTLPAYKVGRQWRIKPEDLEAFKVNERGAA